MEPKAARSFIFFGTPAFSLPALDALVAAGFSLPLVVTAPDRPKGRGLRVEASPVKQRAVALGLEVFQPERLRDPHVLETLQRFSPDGLVVVAYGRLIPPQIFRAFPLGAVNVHPSLLPRYRGPAPVQRAILQGDRSTGVTIMLIDEALDAGPVLAAKEVPIEPFETAGVLSTRLAYEGARLLVETLTAWARGSIIPVPQRHQEATYAPPIQKDETRLDWRAPAEAVVNRCRAFDPSPGAYTLWRGTRLKCFNARCTSLRTPAGIPGYVLGVGDDGLLVRAGDGVVVGLGMVQLEGKRRLPAQECVKGSPGIIHAVLGT